MLKFKLHISSCMELFSSSSSSSSNSSSSSSSRRWTPKNYTTHAWHNSIVVWLLGRYSCSSPSTKELHASWDYNVPPSKDVSKWNVTYFENLTFQKVFKINLTALDIWAKCQNSQSFEMQFWTFWHFCKLPTNIEFMHPINL